MKHFLKSEHHKKYFKALIEDNGDAIALIDRNGNIIYQSPAAEKIGGYTIHENDGKTASQFIHPDDMAEFGEMMRMLAEKPGNSATKQFRIIHKDGHEIWVEGTISNQLHDHAINAFITNYRDITERKLTETKLKVSEQLYRSLFENMLNGFAYCQMHYDDHGKPFDFTYLATNTAFETQTGLHDVVGKRVTEIIPNISEKDATIFEIYGRVADTGQPENFETYFESLQDWYWISVYSPAKSYFVAVFDVITKRKQAEASITKLNAELEERVLARTIELSEANKALEAFSYSASHDLKAPVRAIMGFSKIILSEYKDKIDPEVGELLEYIDDSAKHMNEIIIDLLALAKYGREELRFTSVDMTRMIKDVWASISHSTSHNATLDISELPAVTADFSMIEQVATNLISNAIKYSSKKETPMVRIWSERTQDELIFYFRDNGAGFDMKHFDRLFRAFQRLHPSADFDGTGVGLTLVKKIVEKHGGRVGADAKVNEGATFYFTLPLESIQN